MLRYVALVWDMSNPESCERTRIVAQRLVTSDPAWNKAIALPGFTLFTLHARSTDGAIVRIPSDGGAMVGRLFRRNVQSADVSVQTVRQFSDKESAALIDSGGRYAIANYWGSYVLFVRNPISGMVRALRGPTSLQPCFYTTIDAVTIFFSFVDDVLTCAPRRWTVNWDSITAQAAWGDYLTSETGIDEIRTTIAGECVCVRDGKITAQTYWNPAQYRDSPIREIEAAATAMRVSTQHCVNAIVSPHKTVVLQLSGGFDSSVVLSSLVAAPSKPEVISVNLYSHGGGDEREYARSMTRMNDSELIEMQCDTTTDLRTFLNCALTANPVLNFSAYDSQPRIVKIAQDRNATAIFSGEIGDDIFGHAAGAEDLAECFVSHGPGYTSLRATLDYADLTRVSIWRAIKLASRYRNWMREQRGQWSFYRYRGFIGVGNEKTFISDAAAEHYEKNLARFIHPWFRDVEGMPAGRAMLLYALVMATSTWSDAPFAGDGRTLFMTPLASQPLVETFLRIPSHLHFDGGVNGAVARRAFNSMLTREVLQRGTGKGSPSLWIENLVDTNRRFLRELFLDGVLVRQKILDRRKLETMLSGTVGADKLEVSDFVRQLYIEAWLRRWDGLNVAMAA